MSIFTPIAHATERVLTFLDRDIEDGTRPDGQPRGIAVLIALVSLTLLSVVVVDFMYSTRVNLAMASNSRDKAKSYYLAKSATNISSLVLSFQFALQSESKGSKDDMARMISKAMRQSNFQIYSYVDLFIKPFSSGSIETPIGGVNLSDSGVAGFGGIKGEFEAEIVPESGRISLSDFNKLKIEDKFLAPLCALMADNQYDPIFERSDEVDGGSFSRQKILGHIVDFIDPNTGPLRITNECTIESDGANSGGEDRPYDRAGQDARASRSLRPINARLTHIEDLHRVHGVNMEFMSAFGQQLTVYDVGKPNINIATAPVFYSVLCNNVQLKGASSSDISGFQLCTRSPVVAAEVLMLSLALDGVRQYFSDPLSVLLSYVGTSAPRLLPSAKKGQATAFRTLSQLPSYLRDFQKDPALFAQFIQYSPAYQQLVRLQPQMAVDPVNPQPINWLVSFSRSGLVRDVSTKTPSIYRIKGIGRYGSTQTTIETVVDFAKTTRRLPDEESLEESDQDAEDIKRAKEAIRAAREEMQKGRVLYWREY